MSSPQRKFPRQSSFLSQSPWPSKHWFEGLQQPLFSALHPLGPGIIVVVLLIVVVVVVLSVAENE